MVGSIAYNFCSSSSLSFCLYPVASVYISCVSCLLCVNPVDQRKEGPIPAQEVRRGQVSLGRSLNTESDSIDEYFPLLV